MYKLVAAFALSAISSVANAECATDELIGYTLFAKKTIAGTIKDGEKSDDFNGCEFGTVVVFSDNTGVMCLGYYYYYYYMPSALLFSNGLSMKMCVEGELYDVGRIN